MARFDFSSKCAHPKKCHNLMVDFLKAATSLPDEIYLEKGSDGFCTNLEDKPGPGIFIEYDYSDINYPVISHEFLHFVHGKDKLTKGFSELTISLLHELGHNETFKDIPKNYDRKKALRKINKMTGKDLRKANQMYFSLTDENLATEWAVQWLSKKENRKIAKRFEKDFFKAWRG